MFDISNFGIKVFDEKIMKKKLPSPIYKKWMDAMHNKTCTLDRTTADAIAHAMKEWAVEQGCTHYCHCFTINRHYSRKARRFCWYARWRTYFEIFWQEFNSR